MTVKATISYDGSCFFGFQRQKEKSKNIKKSVESTFEEALKSCGIESRIVGSGRTDRGVHATGQVISFELPLYWRDLDKLQTLLNQHLNQEIVVRDLAQAKEGFHPRYDAKSRVYRYFISTKKGDPFVRNYVAYKESIDIKRCNEALNLFKGRHDYKYFRKTGSDEKSTIRVIYKAFAYAYGDTIIFTLEGDGFLRSQVRMIVSAVFAYSDGIVSLEDIKSQLQLQSKKISKPAPHQGLYLAKVKY